MLDFFSACTGEKATNARDTRVLVHEVCNDNGSRVCSKVYRLAGIFNSINHSKDYDTTNETPLFGWYVSYVDHWILHRDGLSVYPKLFYGEAYSSSDTTVLIKTLALPPVARVAEVAPKCL